MSVSLSHVDGPGDAELIAAVRGGDLDSYGELYARHVDAARRLARQLTTPADADDLVSDAFTKVLTVLQRGGGPDLAFRAYLLTAVRRLHVDRLRSGSRLRSVDDLTPFDPGLPFHDTAVEGFDNAAAAKAFASLPERWQMVLWHTEVEGQKPADIAPLLGMSANSVAALAYRAREGLRQAFLSQHAADMDDVDCAWTRDHLGAYVRGGLSRRDAGRVDDHLADCRACAAVYLELTEVNSGLAGLLAPLLLGAAGLGYLGSAHGGAAAAGAVGGGLAGAKAWVATHASLTAVGGVAVTATALLAVYGASHLGGNHAVDAGSGPGLANPGSSSTVGPTTRGSATPRTHAGQTPSVTLRNPSESTLPSAGTTTTTTTAAAPSSAPVEPPSSAPTDGPPMAHRRAHGRPDRTGPPTRPRARPSPRPTSASPRRPRPTRPSAAPTSCARAVAPGDLVQRRPRDHQRRHASGRLLDRRPHGHLRPRRHVRDRGRHLRQAGRAPTPLQRIDVPKTDQTVTITSTAPADAAVDGTYDVRTDPESSVTLTTNAACSVSGTTVTFHHAVPCVVTATLPGDLDHTTATDVQTVDPVAKGTQEITFVAGVRRPAPWSVRPTTTPSAVAHRATPSWCPRPRPPRSARSPDDHGHRVPRPRHVQGHRRPGGHRRLRGRLLRRHHPRRCSGRRPHPDRHEGQ